MKKTRRFAAMVAAMALAATMAVPFSMTASAAATENTISFTDETAGTHMYTAYRIFTGEAEKNGMNDSQGAILANAQWAGTAGMFDDFITALQADDTFKFGTETNAFAGLTAATATEQQLIDVLKDFGYNTSKSKAFATFVVNGVSTYGFPASTEGTTITESNDGYYVIKETAFTAATTGETGGAQTAYLLGVYDASAGAEVKVKADAPSVIKKIEENTKTVNAASTDAKALNSEVSGKYNDVADYCFEDEIPFEIIGSMPSNIADYSTYYYEFTDSWTANQFAIVDGTDSATANTIDAGDFVVTIGNTTIPAAQYTVTPAEGNTGFTLKFDDIKNVKDTDNNAVTINANTIVKVTYNLKFGSAAEIGLSGNENTVKLTYSNNPNHTGSGDDTHTDTPNDTVIAFTYELDVTKYKDEASTGHEAAANEAGFKLQRTSDNKYATVDANYKITGWVTDIADATEVKTATGGTFKFIGLDDGNYVLTETTTPENYNTMSPKTIEVSAATEQVQVYKEDTSYDTAAEVLTALTNGSADTGAVAESIINQKGSTLPSTGGMGTKLFVLGGGVTAAMAGIYLVSKKRTKEENAE